MTTATIEMNMPRKGPASVLTPIQRQLNAPAAGEARVLIEAAGVAYADIVMRQGLYKGQPLPVTPGYDFVGRIEALGPGVAGLSIGQRVAAVTVAGSYATRRNVDVRWLVPAPEDADPVALAAAVLNGLTAWQMFHRIANPQAGESVLVHGAAGGVGSLLLDLARLARVQAIGTASSGKLAVVSSRGGVPLDHESRDVVSRVRDLSQGGVVAAFDHIGGKHFKKVSMPSLRAGGTGVLYGAYDATRDGKVNLLAMADILLNTRFSSFSLFGKGQGVVGYSSAVWRDARLAAYRADLTQVLQLVGSGALSPLVGATFGLRDAAAAQKALESRSVTGKIVLLAQ
ncbi:MAG: zinc-binding dehydrogenase [Cytophagales bacterium]|nr:zinc-binding dehydrogenase [Rhizobacter sp.]